MRTNVYNNNKKHPTRKAFTDSSITLTPAANAGANSAVEIKSTRKRLFAKRSGIAWIIAGAAKHWYHLASVAFARQA
tara:strand:- start:335 stop:565 length:231 start_codon:yes stop_codon:yes gene_type:complete